VRRQSSPSLARPLVIRPTSDCCRPFADLQDRAYERAGSARKRSLAQGVDCARSDRSGGTAKTVESNVMAARISL